MDRRAFLGRVGVGTGAVLLGGTAVHAVEAAQYARATPDSWSSTISAAAVRGQAAVWWSAPALDQVVALTFDDGPTDRFTPGLLDLLRERGIRTTFFVIGALVERFPDLVRRARDEGHEIANHSYDHLSSAVLGRDAVRASIARGADAVEAVTGTRPRWFRPPRGEVTSATLLAAVATGQEVALWSLARDAGGESADDDAGAVRRHLTGSVHPGALVDLHDGIGRSSFATPTDASLVTRREAELRVLPDVLTAWQEAGYRFATMSELIRPSGAATPSTPRSPAPSAAASPTGSRSRPA